MSHSGSVKSCRSTPVSGFTALQKASRVARRVAGDWVAPHRVVFPIVEPGHPGKFGDGREHIEQVVSIRIGRVRAEVERLPIRGARVSNRRGPGDQRLFDQAVVLGETYETRNQVATRPRLWLSTPPRHASNLSPISSSLSRGLILGL